MKVREKVSLLNKNMGKVLRSGMDAQENIERIPTGIFAVDLLIGGGVPVGKWTQFWGAESSGKSTTSLRVIGNYLKLYPKKQVLLSDTEHSFDKKWASNFINPDDLKRLLVSQTDYGEQAVDVVKAVAPSEDLGLIVVDSVANLIATADAEADAGDDTVAQNVKLINKLIRKTVPIQTRKARLKQETTILVINQVRVKFGGRSFGTQYGTPGGKLLRHILHLDLRFYAKNYHKVRNVPIILENEFTVTKNKLGLPRRSGSFKTYLAQANGFGAGAVDDFQTVVAYGKRSGVIKRTGNKWYIGKKTFSTQIKMIEGLKKNKALLQACKKTIMRKCLADPLFSGGIEDGDHIKEE